MLCLIFVITLSCAYGSRPYGPAASCPKCPECPSPPVCPNVTGVAQPGVSTEAEDDVQNLVSRNGWHLAVDAQGKVYGIRAGNRTGTGWDSDGVLQIIQRGKFHQIKGLKAGLYIAMNDQGVVYGERDKENEDTLWQQTHDGNRWRRYKWQGNDKNWYLGFLKSGRTKNGSLTEAKQNAVQFEFIRPEKSTPYRPAATTPSPADVIEQLPLDQQIHFQKWSEPYLFRRLAVSRDRGVHTQPFNGGDGFTPPPDAVFQIFLRRSRSQMQLRGKEAGLYIAMNKQGVVYAEPDRRKINTWWKVKYEGDEHDGIFEWLGNDKGWLLEVGGDGEFKRGNETQKKEDYDYQFLMIPVYKDSACPPLWRSVSAC